MPVRAVCKPHSPDLKKRRARGCSLWRSLLEPPPPAPEFRVRDPLEARMSCGGVDPGGVVTYIYKKNICLLFIYSLFVYYKIFVYSFYIYIYKTNKLVRI